MKTKEKTLKKETTKATHTPGPWDVSRWGKACFEIQGGSKSLAIVNKVQETRNTFLEADSSAKQRRNESTIEEPNYDTTEALQNARLMAAAPDLYEVAKLCRDVVDDDLEERPARHSLGKLHAMLKHVLAKCEGK